jgi:DNA-binding LacI/PurR family transcriptional regulator
MYDVAHLAGVSHQTVSRVLNDHPNVRPETRAKVVQAIEDLGYRRNFVARALVTRRTGAIGVVTEDSPLHGPTMTLISIENAARSQGMYVSVATVTEWGVPAVQGALEHFVDQGVDGLVVIASHDEAVRAVRGFTGQPPIVMVGPSDLGEEVYTVAVNQYAGGRIATRHLLDLGHTDIVHVSGPMTWLDARSRARAWSDTLRQAGIEPPPPISGDWTARTGYRIGTQLVAQASSGERPLPTAVFAGNDQLALGLLHAFAEAGVRVPGDVSVVGYDDVEGSAHFFPPLTTISPDFLSLGERCLDQMAAAMAGAPAVDGLVGASLHLRSSTAAPRSVE